METRSTPAPAQDKQVTVAVPEDRVAEFYAFYARFLAGRRGRRRAAHGPRGRCHHHHQHHGPRREAEHEAEEA